MNKILKIKVCGMKYPENLEQVCRLGPDYVGYILFSGSGRYVGDKPDPALFRIPDNGTGRVGVFVNETLDVVKDWVASGRIDFVQLHGNESPDYCRALVKEGARIIKAMDPAVLLNGEPAGAYDGVVHSLLFDTPAAGYGGSGHKFDWGLLSHYRSQVPFFLSGGIGPGDEREVQSIKQESLTAVDLNSRFESEKGVKDVRLLEHFMKNIRKK